MKRIKIFKVYFILWLFVYFIAISNIETFKLYFMSTLTFNIAIVTLLAIGTIMLLKAAKEVVMLAGTFGVLMYKKKNLPFYIRGISKVLPTNIADKITKRAENNLLLFTQQEKEEILSWIDEQFANQNKYNNFFIGTVLMIGLLGTFSGLLGAIGSMASIVMSLSGSDIDIGQIMAGFSGPLSSMAVGFGSSLFGVISAILLSIKGYLLNRAQASVMDGVENWLNKNTVDIVQIEAEDRVEDSHKVLHKQPTFMDIFIDKIGYLQDEIKLLNQNNRVLQEAFINSAKMIENLQKNQTQSLNSVTQTMNLLYEQIKENRHTTQNLNQELKHSSKIEQKLLYELIKLQEKQNFESTNINTNLEDLVHLISHEKEDIDFKNRVLKALENENSEKNTIALFQMADSLDSFKKDVVSEIKSIKKESEHSKDIKVENSSFLKKHFESKRDTKVVV